MRRVDIYTEHKGCGDRWRLYVSGVLPSCWRQIVSALEHGGESVLVTATPGRSGLGRHVYQTEPSVCLAGNPTVGDLPCGDPDCVCR